MSFDDNKYVADGGKNAITVTTYHVSEHTSHITHEPCCLNKSLLIIDISQNNVEYKVGGRKLVESKLIMSGQDGGKEKQMIIIVANSLQITDKQLLSSCCNCCTTNNNKLKIQTVALQIP